MAKRIALELGKVCRLARAFARALGARMGHLLSFVVSSRLCELYRSLHAFSSRSGPEEGCDRTLPSQCTDDNHGRILESGERTETFEPARAAERASQASHCAVALAQASPSRHRPRHRRGTRRRTSFKRRCAAALDRPPAT